MAFHFYCEDLKTFFFSMNGLTFFLEFSANVIAGRDGQSFAMEPSTPAQPRPSTAVFRHPPRSVAFNHKVQPRPSIYSVVLTSFLSLRRRVAPTFRGKTCLLATNQSKLEKVQADYDQACKAYSEIQQRLFDAAEKQPRDEVQVQILQTALANAEKDKDRAWQTVELERKQTPQSEASEVAKKYMFVVSI